MSDLRINNLHIVFSLLILVNLLFVQIVPDYLHTHDSDKKELCQEDHGEAELQLKKEICKLCSIDLFHDLFYLAISDILLEVTFQSDLSVEKTLDTNALIFSTAGRSPPSYLLS